jgi:PTS system N-acetylglucosamine-specific IIC component
VIADQALVNEPGLRALGTKGIIRPSAQALQVVLGPIADTVASEIRTAAAAAGGGGPIVAVSAAMPDAPVALDLARLPADLLAALGEVRSVSASHSRLMVESAGTPDLPALTALGLRGSAQAGPVWHLLFAPEMIAGWR